MSLEKSINKLAWVGSIIFILASIIQVAVVARAGLWRENQDSWPSNSRVPGFVPEFVKNYGEKQKEYWQGSMNDLAREKRVAEQRAAFFEKAREDSLSQFYSGSRDNYKEEKRLANELRIQFDKTKIQSGGKNLLYYAAYSILLMAVALAATKRFQRDAQRLFDAKISGLKWKNPYIYFFLIFSGTSLVTYSLSSIFIKQKDWIGASSFFICWQAWLAERFSNIGVLLIVAIPMAICWCLTSEDKIPIESIDLTSPDGMCAVRDYMTFLQGWSIAGLGIFSLATVAGFWEYLRSQFEYSPIYFLMTSVFLVALGVMLIRMFKNALKIRAAYWEMMRKKFKTNKEAKDAGVPPDPTIGFLGENWTGMIAIWSGVLGLAWTVLGLFGLSKVITGFLQ
jgi:hypothetical protein